MKKSEAFRQAAIEFGHTPEEVEQRMNAMRLITPIVDGEVEPGKEREAIEGIKRIMAEAQAYMAIDPPGFQAAMKRQLDRQSRTN